MIQSLRIKIFTLYVSTVFSSLSGSEVKVTLWGQRATEFTIDDIYDANNPKPVVVLFVGCLMKTFMGTTPLSKQL